MEGTEASSIVSKLEIFLYLKLFASIKEYQGNEISSGHSDPVAFLLFFPMLTSGFSSLCPTDSAASRLPL
jgi:hypothetical protein